ncbi:hypothetical protein Tco_0677034 [Tanacetum coccineum]
MIPNPDNDQEEILELLSKITAGNKSQHIANVKVMNYLLQAIPNEIYNLVDACKNAKEMWERIKRMMFGSECKSTPSFSIACNPSEITMVRHNQIGGTVSYDVLYDSLVQFEPHVLASKAKKASKNHDPLALIAHLNASSSQSYANSSYSPQPYDVTHPSSVVDYEDEYQGEL